MIYRTFHIFSLNYDLSRLEKRRHGAGKLFTVRINLNLLCIIFLCSFLSGQTMRNLQSHCTKKNCFIFFFKDNSSIDFSRKPKKRKSFSILIFFLGLLGLRLFYFSHENDKFSVCRASGTINNVSMGHLRP